MTRTILPIILLLFILFPEVRMAAQNTQSAGQRQRNVTSASNPSQWALLIGVSDYPGEIQDLRFASADARSIKELLVSSAGVPEDHIRLLTDDGVGEAKATKQNIFAAVDQYLAPRVQPGHQIIVFLAGHGIVRGLGAQAKSYLLPADTDAQTKESLERTAIDLEELSGKLSALKASQFTVFFDACREDPFPGRGLKGNTLTDVTARILTDVSNRPLQTQSEPPTSVIFYACQIGERAYESAKLQQGVFTYYILRGLRELADRPDGRVEAGRLAGYLSENVRRWSREEARIAIEQNPTMIATEVRGPVLIARITPLSTKIPMLSTTSGLLLRTAPEGALLIINGHQAGRGPLQKEVSPNQYTVRAELPGFQPAETRVDALAGYQQEITINLQPIAGNPNYEKGLQFEKQQLWPQAIASYEQALRDDPNSISHYERLAQAYMRDGRNREAVDLLTVGARKFPESALILARRSRALSALAGGEEGTHGSLALHSDDKPSKKGKKGKKKPEEAESSDQKESGNKVKGSKADKSSKKDSVEETEATESGDQEKGGKKGKSSKSGKSSKKDSTEETEEAVSGNQEEGGKKGKSSKGGKSSKKDPTEEIEEDKGGKSGKSGKSSKKSSAEEIQGRQLIVGAPVEPQKTGKSQGADGATGISEAIRDAELAIQKDERLAEGHLALGFACLSDEKYYDRALAAFVRASTLAPEDAEAYYGVGYVYRLKQQFQQAVPQLKKAIELRPDYYEAQRELAYCYHAMGNTDQAIRQYEIASSYRRKVKAPEEFAANNLALATLYYKKGDEVGGAEGEEYKKASKACENDAREHEPSLKGAAKRLSDAGVSKFVEDKLSPDIRKIMIENRFLKDAKPPIRIKTPIDTRIKTPIDTRIKTPIDTRIKTPIDTKIKIPKDTKIETPKDSKIKIPKDSKIKIPDDTKIETPKDSKIKVPKDSKIKTLDDSKIKSSKDSKRKSSDNSKIKSSKDSKLKTSDDIKSKTPIDTRMPEKIKTPTKSPTPTSTKTPIAVRPKLDVPLRKP